MDEKYLRMLPVQIAQKVKEIEDLMKTAIVVRTAGEGEMLARFAGCPAGVSYGLKDGSADAEIVLRDANVHPHFIAHEVLHIHRSFVLGCLGLGTEHSGLATMVIVIENDVEHIDIVREEIGLFPEAATYWTASLLDGSSRPAKNDVIRRYVLASLIFDAPHVAEKTLELLHTAFHTDARDRLAQFRISTGKVSRLRGFIEDQGMPLHAFYLKKFDLPKRCVERYPFV